MLPRPVGRSLPEPDVEPEQLVLARRVLHLAREREQILLHVVPGAERAEPGEVGGDRGAHLEDREPSSKRSLEGRSG